MRNLFVVAAVLSLLAIPDAARAQGNTAVQGFGAFTVGTSSALGGASFDSAFGGTIAAGLTPNIQIVGEVGRLSDIKPPVLDVLNFTPADLHVSAWYGEGGVRLIASPRSPVRPYGEATAGMARLSAGVSGIGGRADAVIDTGLAFLNRTEPLLGVGGGVMLQAGPIAVDLGYRYKKIVATGVASALNAGREYQVNEVRFGFGVSF